MKTNGIEIKKNLLLALFSVLLAVSAVLAVAFSLLPVTAHAAGEGMQVALSLQSDLVLKITAEEADSLTVYVRGKNNEELNKAELTEKNAAGQFEYHGVTPQLMSNTVVLQDNASNEKEVSVKDYCTELLEGTAEGFGMSAIKFEALQTLAADILNYGAAAQAYMQSEYQSNDLANAGLTETQKDISARYAAQTAPETVKGSTGEATEGIYIRGTGVRFDNNAGIYFTVVAPAGTEGLGLEVELNGRSETLTGFTVTEEENVYTVLYEDIYIAEYGLPVVGQLTRGGEKIGNEVTYSVNSYVASKADGNDEALSDLVKSLYVFNQSALAYENADTMDYAVTAANISVDAEGKPQLTITGNLFGYTAEDFTLRYARLDPWPWVYSDIETFEMTTEGGQFTLTADLSFLTSADDKTTSEDGIFYQKYIFYFMLNGEEEKALPFGNSQTFIYDDWRFEVYSEYGNLALRVTEVPQE